MHTSVWPVFIKNSSAGKGFSPLARDSKQIRNFYLVRYTISVCNIKTWFSLWRRWGLDTQQGQEALLKCHGLRWSLTTQYNNKTKHRSSDWAVTEKQLLPLSYQGRGMGSPTSCHMDAHQHRNLSEKLGDFGIVSGWWLGFTSRLRYLRIGFALWTCGKINISKGKRKQIVAVIIKLKFAGELWMRWRQGSAWDHPGHWSEVVGKYTAHVGVVGFTEIILLW